MQSFMFVSPQEVHFGIGKIKELGQLSQKVGIKSALIVSDAFLATNGYIKEITDSLDSQGIKHAVFSDFESSPTVSQVEKGAELIHQNDYDGIIGFGGGSSLDVAKGISVLGKNPGPLKEYFGIEKVPQKGVPLILIPTTAGAGSEVSDACILKDDVTHLKGGIRSRYILPNIALLDPGLTVSMPPALTASTGMDALTHAIEGYVSNNASILTRMYHREAIRLISSNLRTAVGNGRDLQARYCVMLGSLYAGWAMAVASLGACHAMAYPVEAKCNAPHGDVCAALLPSVMRFNVLGNMELFREMAIAMGQPVDGLSVRDAAYKAVEAVEVLAEDLNIRTLSQIGAAPGDLDSFAKDAVDNTRLMSFNPRPMKQDACRLAYECAM